MIIYARACSPAESSCAWRPLGWSARAAYQPTDRRRKLISCWRKHAPFHMSSFRAEPEWRISLAAGPLPSQTSATAKVSWKGGLACWRRAHRTGPDPLPCLLGRLLSFRLAPLRSVKSRVLQTDSPLDSTGPSPAGRLFGRGDLGVRPGLSSQNDQPAHRRTRANQIRADAPS
jgi:hypothetical protein